MDRVIFAENLKKTYTLPRKNSKGQKNFEAVKGISFEVFKGEVFGILGPNGAGKTTTLEIIEGLKQQTSGVVNVLGFDNIKQADEIKKRIGVQLQSSDYLPYLTLAELMDLFASLYNSLKSPLMLMQRGGKPQAPALFKKGGGEELLTLVSLKDKQHEQFKNLSGGQKQRFTIATSLVNRPQILFLDEPTTGLDPAARRNLWQLIKQINLEGITIVLTTHYMEEAEFLCERVAIMDKGKILEIDEPKKLIEDLSRATQVSFFTSEPIDEKIFQNLPEINKIYSQYPKTILEIKSLDRVSAIIGALKNHRVSFSGFTLKTASLEDVYLRLTGKEFEDE